MTKNEELFLEVLPDLLEKDRVTGKIWDKILKIKPIKECRIEVRGYRYSVTFKRNYPSDKYNTLTFSWMVHRRGAMSDIYPDPYNRLEICHEDYPTHYSGEDIPRDNTTFSRKIEKICKKSKRFFEDVEFINSDWYKNS